MNYTPTQLEAIRIFGRKELSFGCIVKSGRYAKIISNDYDDDNGKTGRHRFIDDGENIFTGVFESEYEILGHEPHLEDVFRVLIKEKGHINLLAKKDDTYEIWITRYEHVTVKFPYNPTLPLLEQSESTLQQLISLFE